MTLSGGVAVTSLFGEPRREGRSSWLIAARQQVTVSGGTAGAASVAFVGLGTASKLTFATGLLVTGAPNAPKPGLLPRVSTAPVELGAARLVLALELPMVFEPGAVSLGLGAVPGVEYRPTPWMLLGVDAPIYYFVLARPDAARLYPFAALRAGLLF